MVSKQKYILPEDNRKHRSCFRCHLVKTERQFIKDSCENCPFFEGYDIQDYTTENFGCLVCIAEPEESWFAKQIGVEKMVPGSYAIHLRGQPTDAIQDLMNEYKHEIEA